MGNVRVQPAHACASIASAALMVAAAVTLFSAALLSPSPQIADRLSMSEGCKGQWRQDGPPGRGRQSRGRAASILFALQTALSAPKTKVPASITRVVVLESEPRTASRDLEHSHSNNIWCKLSVTGPQNCTPLLRRQHRAKLSLWPSHLLALPPPLLAECPLNTPLVSCLSQRRWPPH